MFSDKKFSACRALQVSVSVQPGSQGGSATQLEILTKSGLWPC